MLKIKNVTKNYSLSSIALSIYFLIIVFLPKNISKTYPIPIKLIFTFIITLIFIYDIIVNKKEIRKTKNFSLLVVFTLFIISTIPSLLVTRKLITSLYTITKFLISFIFLYVLFKIKFDKKESNFILNLLKISLILICLLGICQYVFKINLFTAGIEYYPGAVGRVETTFFNTIYYSIFLNIFFPIILYLFFKEESKKKVVGYFILSVLMYVNILITFTRSSYIILWLVFMLLIILLFKISFKFRTLFLIVTVVALNVIIPGGNSFTKKTLTDGVIMISNSSTLSHFLPFITNEFYDDQYLDYDEDSVFKDYSLQHREEFARIAKRIGNDNIYTGVGFGTYIDYMKSKDFQKKYPNYKLSKTHPHSAFILIFAETGVFSLSLFSIFFILLFLNPFICFIKNIKGKEEVRELTTILLAITCGFILVNMISENAVYDTQIFPIFIIAYSILYGYIIDNLDKKVIFISSTGGHLSELLQLEPIFKKFNNCIITEKTKSTLDLDKKYNNVYYLMYGTKHHIFSYIFKFLYNCFKTLILYIKIRPNVIVTTGTHTAVPMCYIGKFFGSKVIFIETFANSKTKTISGKLIYPIADSFIVQWDSMLDVYPKAVYGGWIY